MRILANQGFCIDKKGTVCKLIRSVFGPTTRAVMPIKWYSDRAEGYVERLEGQPTTEASGSPTRALSLSRKEFGPPRITGVIENVACHIYDWYVPV